MFRNHDVPPSVPANAPQGHVVKVHAEGPGSSLARHVAALRRAFVTSISPKDIEDLVRILMLKARGGDLAAVKLLFQYFLRRPR